MHRNALEHSWRLPGRSGTLLEASKALQDALEQFHADNKVFRIVQEVWIDENSVFCDLRASRKRLEDIPGGFQDAPGRSGTLQEASGTLLEVVGRAWQPPGHPGRAQTLRL